MCALVLSWCNKRPRSLVFGCLLHQASKTCSRHWSIYQSAVTVCLSCRGTVAICPDVQKKQESIFFSTLCTLLTFCGGVSFGNSQTADCCFVLGSKLYKNYPSFIVTQDILDLFCATTVESLRHEIAPFNPTPQLLIFQRVGYPPC